jgi:hypothetical protein
MPYKDPQKQREATRKAVAKHRARPVAELLGLEGLPEPPSEDECVRLLGVKARAGNVPAIKLLLERPWEKRADGDRDTSTPLSRVDELAARRRVA